MTKVNNISEILDGYALECIAIIEDEDLNTAQRLHENYIVTTQAEQDIKQYYLDKLPKEMHTFDTSYNQFSVEYQEGFNKCLELMRKAINE